MRLTVNGCLQKLCQLRSCRGLWCFESAEVQFCWKVHTSGCCSAVNSIFHSSIGLMYGFFFFLHLVLSYWSVNIWTFLTTWCSTRLGFEGFVSGTTRLVRVLVDGRMHVEAEIHACSLLCKMIHFSCSSPLVEQLLHFLKGHSFFLFFGELLLGTQSLGFLGNRTHWTLDLQNKHDALVGSGLEFCSSVKPGIRANSSSLTFLAFSTNSLTLRKASKKNNQSMKEHEIIMFQ